MWKVCTLHMHSTPLLGLTELTLAVRGGVPPLRSFFSGLLRSRLDWRLERWNLKWMTPQSIRTLWTSIYFQAGSGHWPMTSISKPPYGSQNVATLQRCQWQASFLREIKLTKSNNLPSTHILKILDFSWRLSGPGQVSHVTFPIGGLRGVLKLLILPHKWCRYSKLRHIQSSYDALFMHASVPYFYIF